MHTSTHFRNSRIAAAAVALAALALSTSSLAAADAASTNAADAHSATEATLALSSTYRNANGGGPLTREQVREELRQARESGTLSTFGEAGDTPQVLAAREAFNTAQAETIVAEVVADQQRTVALAQAELRRAQIETEAAQAQALALSDGESLVPDSAAATVGDETEVRIDTIDTQTSATSQGDELIILSLDGGDAAHQHAIAMHVRRQLGAMGLPQDRIYVEGDNAEGDDDAAMAQAEADMEAIDRAADGEAVTATGGETDSVRVAGGDDRI